MIVLQLENNFQLFFSIENKLEKQVYHWSSILQFKVVFSLRFFPHEETFDHIPPAVLSVRPGSHRSSGGYSLTNPAFSIRGKRGLGVPFIKQKGDT